MSELVKNDYFKIDPEFHMIGDMEPLNHFPGVQMWWRAIANIGRPLATGVDPKYFEGVEEWEVVKQKDPEILLNAMDKYGVDIACLLPESMMDTTGYSSRWCSNGDMAKVVKSIRIVSCINQPSPVKYRGKKRHLGNGILVKEKGAKIFGITHPKTPI